MARQNRFEQLFNNVSESREASETIRTKLTEGALELNRAKKMYSCKEKELTDARHQVADLKMSNRELKVAMVQAMIEHDELEAKKKCLRQKIEKMEQDIDGLDRQSDYILRSVGGSVPNQPRDNKS